MLAASTQHRRQNADRSISLSYLVTSCVVLFASIPAAAQVTSYPANVRASYLLQGFTATPTGGNSYLDSKSAVLDSHDNPINLISSVGGTDGTGGSTATVSASTSIQAAAGFLHAKISGNAAATWIHNQTNSEARIAQSFARVGWDDFYIINGNPMLPQPGREVLISAVLLVNGSMTVGLSPDPIFPEFSLVASGLDARVTGRDGLGRNVLGGSPVQSTDIYARESKTTALGGTTLHEPAPAGIPVTLRAYEGTVNSITFQLELNAFATARELNNLLDGGNSVSFSSDFSHTLTWGGISSVVDAATGQPLDTWSIESASGINYADPVTVPEPAFAALALLLLPMIRR